MRHKIYSISFVAIVLAFVGSYFAFIRDSVENAKLTTETEAAIENVDVRRAVNPIFGNEVTVDVSVTYKYTIDAREYRQTTRLSESEAGAFVPWGVAKVCFDPNDQRSIAEGKLFPRTHTCGDG